MKEIRLDKTNSKIIGRSLMVGENRWLALSGAGVDFAFYGKKLKMTQRNGKIFCAHGVEKLRLLKCSYYIK